MSVEDLVAIRVDSESAYAALVCDPQQACTECLPDYPMNVHAYCTPEGFCDLAWQTSPGSG